MENCSESKTKISGQDTKLSGEVSSLKALQLSLEEEIRTLKGNNQDKIVDELTYQLGECNKDKIGLNKQINRDKNRLSEATKFINEE